MNAGSPAAERTLVIERLFDAPPGLLFQVWTKPEHVSQWWGRRDFTLPFCEMDFRPGGSYRYCMRSPQGVNHWVYGEYREIIEPEKIVMTWNRENEAGELWSRTLVNLTFVEEKGKTRFTLHQAVFESTEYRDQHNGGWSQCLDRLAEYVISGNVALPPKD